MNLSNHTIGSFCEFIKNELNGLYPEREIHNYTDLILLHFLGIPKHEIHLEKSRVISHSHCLRMTQIVRELRMRKPIQYIFGHTDFFGLKMRVSSDALIPRPETEELVKWIIDDHSGNSPEILDIGTGCGCIAIALKKNLPEARIHASDVSSIALKLAVENAELQRLDINFFHQDITLYNPLNYNKSSDNHLSGKNTSQEENRLYDIIVSNPPYIPLQEKPAIDRNISDYEPEIALFVPDEDPLIFYRHIAYFALDHLKKDGYLYLEIHEKSGPGIKTLLEKLGYNDVIIRKDINGKNRMVRCMKK